MKTGTLNKVIFGLLKEIRRLENDTVGPSTDCEREVRWLGEGGVKHCVKVRIGGSDTYSIVHTTEESLHVADARSDMMLVNVNKTQKDQDRVPKEIYNRVTS